MKKSQKITIISSISAIALVAAAYISYPYIFKDSPIQSTDPTSSIVSSAPLSASSDATSSETSSIVVPEIEAPASSEAPAVSSAPTEIKVEGSPTSKPTSKPNNTSSKPPVTNKPTAQVTPPTKPTGNGDVYDPLTGTYPKIGDKTTSPRSGAQMTWTGTAWMTDEASGKSGDGQDALDQAHAEGYTGKDIGADD